MLSKLDHIAFRVKDIEPVVNFYTSTMGFKVVQEMEMDFGGSIAKSKVLNLPGNPFFIFVDMGLDENNIITKWVAKYGNRLHHMAYLTEDIYTTFEHMKNNGIKFTTNEVVDTGGGLKQLFTLPNPDTGLLTEIIQREKDDIFFVQGNVIKLIESTSEIE